MSTINRIIIPDGLGGVAYIKLNSQDTFFKGVAAKGGIKNLKKLSTSDLKKIADFEENLSRKIVWE